MITQNQIHFERANYHLKEFRIQKFIPSHMRNLADKLVQVCCGQVNLQAALIKKVAAETPGSLPPMLLTLDSGAKKKNLNVMGHRLTRSN